MGNRDSFPLTKTEVGRFRTWPGILVMQTPGIQGRKMGGESERSRSGQSPGVDPGNAERRSSFRPMLPLSYNDWYSKIGSGQVAMMAFCGSDALALPVSTFQFPLSTTSPSCRCRRGTGVSRYSLYGGTPYVFSANATDEQVKGAPAFLKILGRFLKSTIFHWSGMELGFQTGAGEEPCRFFRRSRPGRIRDYLEVANELRRKIHQRQRTWIISGIFLLGQ